MKKTIAFLALFLTIFSSCSIRKMVINEVADMMDYGVESIMQENDLRVAEASLLSNLKLIETLSRANPENKKLLLYASMGYGSYALGFVEDSSPERASNLYLRAKEYGLKILRMNEDFKKSENADAESFQNSLKSFTKDDVPYLFWTAYNWGNLINLNVSDPEIMSDLPKANALIERALSLDEGYYFGGSHLYFGTIYSKIPKMLGGNPDKSKEHFEKALKLNEGKFLMSYVYYAKMYAVAIQDKDLFINLLNKAIDAPVSILPEQVLPNMMAKQKAKVLLENVDNYF
jgi:tetratricopeptide (TPR) repeat protein